MKTMLLILLCAIAEVESRNGKDANADGNIFQITPICVEDVNRIYGTYYTMRDVQYRHLAEDIAIRYLTYWGSRCSDNPNMETFARIWHRGPNKWRDLRGEKYWWKVKAVLEKKYGK